DCLEMAGLPQPTGAVLARVGNTVITDTQFREYASRSGPEKPAASAKERRKILDSMIRDRILMQVARRMNLDRDAAFRARMQAAKINILTSRLVASLPVT